MPSATAVRGMLRTDMLRLRRDRFLVGVCAIIFVYAIALRWLLPEITTVLATRQQFDLTPYFPLVVSVFNIQVMPLIPGMIGGFLLLESREERTVKAMMVSPNPLTSYLWVACVTMSVLAAILTVIGSAIIALALPSWPAVCAVGLAAAPWAPAFALLIATLANDKVQAFAYMKIFGQGAWVVTGAYFLPEPWQWLAAIYPPYCASKAYWVAEAGGPEWPLWVLGGLVSAAAWCLVLQRLFLRAARS